MSPAESTSPRHDYTCVFRGSRDDYQVAAALAEAGRLDHLVTDFYTPDLLMALLHRKGPQRLTDYFARRHSSLVPSRLIDGSMLDALPLGKPWSQVEDVKRRMGRRGAQRAQDGAIVYSYYWPSFLGSATCTGPRIVFQVHPVASQIRAELSRDRSRSGIEDGLEAEERFVQERIEAENRELLRADGVLCASNFVRDGLANIGWDAKQVHVTPYGIERPSLAPSATTATDKRHPDGPLRLLWVGQLAYRKAPHWLFDAMRALPADRVQLTLSTRSELPSWLGQLPTNVTHVHGASDRELSDLYRTHDLFVMPSLIEGFGLVYLEALAAGLPILATRNSGVPDIAQHGENSWLVEAGSANAIQEALEHFLADPRVLADLRAGAAARPLPSWSDFRDGVRAGIARVEDSLAGRSST